MILVHIVFILLVLLFMNYNRERKRKNYLPTGIIILYIISHSWLLYELFIINSQRGYGAWVAAAGSLFYMGILLVILILGTILQSYLSDLFSATGRSSRDKAV